MTATAKINNQHHFMTLKIVWSKGVSVNLTVSHSGTRASSPPEIMEKTVFNRMFKAFDAATWTDKTAIVGTVGERLAIIAKLAEASPSPLAFTQLLEEACAKGAPQPALTPREATVKALAAEVVAKTTPAPEVKDFTRAEAERWVKQELPKAHTRDAIVARIKSEETMIEFAKKGSARPNSLWAHEELLRLLNVALAPKTATPTPLPKEGSGKFMQRMWMAGHNDPDALVALVLQHYPNRTTTRSDVSFNVTQLRKTLGADKVPAWPKKV